ncbi:MAG: peptidylprolyl isomerase [Bacteroidaceae bacterium]|nr:peptidylprolyl isomerase [Bacteroidaceae bacterium]
MKNKFALLQIIFCCLVSYSISASTTMDEKKTPLVRISTSMGDIVVRLYDDTPIHRDNFLKLAREGFYDGTLFHRVINKFMIQAGDPESKGAAPGVRLGAGDVGYTLPAEFVYPTHFHKRGVLSAARQGDQVNPERRSSGCQFYIVTGNVYTPGQLQQFGERMLQQRGQQLFDELAQQHADSIRAMYQRQDQAGLQKLQSQLTALVQHRLAEESKSVFNDEQVEAYTTVGGTPHLDGQYTVFGEVVEGMNIVNEIQMVETDSSDRPTADVVILKMTVLE